MVAREQFRWTPRFLVAGHVAPTFLGRIGRRPLVQLRNVIEHEPLALAVGEDATLTTHAFRHQNAPHARRPYHAGGMKLDEFHIEQVRPRVVRQRMPVAGVFPAVARHLVRPPDTTGRQHDRLRLEQPEPPALAVVPERPHHAIAILQQLDHRALHVHLDALMNAVVLQCANHLQPCSVAHVRQSWIRVPAKVPLQNPPVLRPVKQRPPSLQFVHPRRCLLGVQLRHRGIVQILPAAHRVGKMRLPPVALIHIGHRRRHTALGHHGVRLAQQALANQPHGAAFY